MLNKDESSETIRSMLFSAYTKTRQTCHVWGARGERVEDETSTTEREGSSSLCTCAGHFHDDINAARNIIHVQDPSTVPEWTKDICTGLSNLHGAARK